MWPQNEGLTCWKWATYSPTFKAHYSSWALTSLSLSHHPCPPRSQHLPELNHSVQVTMEPISALSTITTWSGPEPSGQATPTAPPPPDPSPGCLCPPPCPLTLAASHWSCPYQGLHTIPSGVALFPIYLPGWPPHGSWVSAQTSPPGCNPWSPHL